MHSSGSYILSAVETIRTLLNEATFDAKFNDHTIVRTFLTDALVNVVARLNEGSQAKVVVRAQFSVADGTTSILLPQHVGAVIRVAEYDTDGNMLRDYVPSHADDRKGAIWKLDGNRLKFDPSFKGPNEIEVHYYPTAFINMHYSTDGVVPSLEGATTFTLSASPTTGLIGYEENEYVGASLRVIPAGGPHCTRTIIAYDPSTRIVTLDEPLPELPRLSPLPYEVIPAGALSLWGAAPAQATLTLAINRRVSGLVYSMLVDNYRVCIKTLRDTLFNAQSRSPRSMSREQYMFLN